MLSKPGADAEHEEKAVLLPIMAHAASEPWEEPWKLELGILGP